MRSYEKLKYFTSNLGVGGSNPSERANIFKYLAKKQKTLGSLQARSFELTG
jgi:hypothetical protein